MPLRLASIRASSCRCDTGAKCSALSSQQRPRIEGVEQDLRIAESRSRDEMTRQPYAFHGEPETLTHFHQHEAQRDRDALSPVEDLVEKAVARVVVVLAVAREALLHEEVLAQAVEAADGIGRAPRAVHAASEGVESLEIRIHVELGVLPAGDGQRRSRQIDAA